MKNFSQTFVNYHGCGNGYLDGTNKIVPEGRRCIMPTNNPFWKKPIDTSNKIAKTTRSQIKNKTKAKRNYMNRYAKYVRVFHEKKWDFDNALWSSDYSTDDSNYNSGDESKSNASIIANATETEQNISDNELTEENLIIDENTENNHEHKHSLTCSCTLDIQNSNSKNNEQTPNNKETNNKSLPADM